MFRLVTADVAFYTGNLQALKGLKDLDLNMAEIWEQKRWWHIGKLDSLSDHGMCMFVKKIWMPVIQELNLEPKVNWGREREKVKYQCWETGIQWGSTRNANFVLPSVRSNWSGVYNIFHSLWKQTQASLDQIQKNT